MHIKFENTFRYSRYGKGPRRFFGDGFPSYSRSTNTLGFEWVRSDSGPKLYGRVAAIDALRISAIFLGGS